MKNLFLLFSMLCLMIACQKDSIKNENVQLSQSLEIRGGGQVDMCHVNGKGEFSAIRISRSAISAHLAHGDYLPDADGDGYTAIGSCTGSMDDCDDHNPEIGPGNCNCLTQSFLDNFGPFEAFLDIDACPDSFDPFSNGIIMVGQNSIIYVVIVEGTYAIATESSAGLCVHLPASESEYLAALSLLHTYLTAHPDLINICEESPTIASKTRVNKLYEEKINALSSKLSSLVQQTGKVNSNK